MYHLGGNVFLGGFLAYLPVEKPIISLNLSYVHIKRVEQGKDGWGDRSRRVDLRCVSLTFSVSSYLSPLLPFIYISFLSTFFLLLGLLSY